MFHRAISLALIAVFLHGSVAAQMQPQSPTQTVAKMQQVLHKAQEKDKAVKVTLNKKIDNQGKFTAKVSEISDASFIITDQQTGKPIKLVYEDVREVNKKGMSKGAKIGIGVAIGVAVLAVVAVAVTKPWQSE